jgi:hypothetical protein
MHRIPIAIPTNVANPKIQKQMRSLEANSGITGIISDIIMNGRNIDPRIGIRILFFFIFYVTERLR